MDYKKGVRVRNPLAPDWGIGEVLEDSARDTVKVFFVGVGEKPVSLKGFELLRVEGAEANHPILDNLKISSEKELRYRSLPESIQKFLMEFPNGFYGEKFADNERDYKVNAHRLMKELLSKDDLQALLNEGNHEETCRRALKIVNSTNLIFPNEKMSLKDGLKSSEHKKRFAETLYSHLFGDSNLEKRFMELCDLLYEMKAGKWTVATYFLYFMFPDHHMFIKPTVTRNSADICGFDIRYRPDLNWATYEAVLRFSQFLKDELAKHDLKPRDMIDVQSFMWCIRPDKTLKSFGKKKAKQTGGDESESS